MPIDARNARLKAKVLSAPYEICIERARYYTQSYRETEGQHPALRAAAAFAHTLRNMSVRIWDDERIVGSRSGKFVAANIPIERGDINTVLTFELEQLRRRAQQPFHISDEEKRELEREILPYWRGKTMRDRKKRLWKDNGLVFVPAFGPVSLWRRWRSLDLARMKSLALAPGTRLPTMLRELRELLYNNPAFVMNVFDIQGHLILGHGNVLREGFAGIKARASAGAQKARESNDAEAEAFLSGVVMTCDAIRDFAGRYADEAERAANATEDPPRRQELLDIAARCRHVPCHPPRNFKEAVQALWLTQVGALIAYGIAVFAVGRLDQHLYPFFERDLATGRLTEAEAVAWIEELLIKLAGGLLVLPHVGKQTGSELGSDSCSPTVGGIGPNGEDAVNRLSYLILDAFANIKSLGNSFMVRLSNKNPDAFWRATIAAHRETSGAALFCDDVVVDALKRSGVNERDARDYGVIGCVEPTGDGNTFGCTSANDVSLAAAVEMTLLDGRLRIMGKRVGPRTGDPRRFGSFEEFLDAYKQHVAFMIDTVARATDLKDQAYQESFPNPFVSAMLTGCIESGRDMTSGGARYNFGSITGRGFATAVNSLSAVRHFVFDRREIGMDELLRALDVNFRGHELLRKRLETAPKYGCDDDRADAIAADVCAFFCNEVAAHQTIRGGPYRPGFFSYGMHVLEGLFLGATPDGRRAGEPVSNSFSPATGTELRGPTAALRSIAKNDHRLIGNGCAVNVRLQPEWVQDDAHIERVVGLVKGYFAMSGMEVQFNVVSSETLVDAQEHPERHRDLVVRVSGYSALFTDLGKPLQDEIIRRTTFPDH